MDEYERLARSQRRYFDLAYVITIVVCVIGLLLLLGCMFYYLFFA